MYGEAEATDGVYTVYAEAWTFGDGVNEGDDLAGDGVGVTKDLAGVEIYLVEGGADF